MLNATFRPLEVWPGKQTPSWSRARAPFRAKYPDTLNLLEKEIGQLYGVHVVIQAYFTRGDIRNDGWPRSSARPTQPGVIVTFQSNRKPLSFPCDHFDEWEDNLRAIALSLEALRKVDRYGVTKTGEQYRGFAQIEPPKADAQMSAIEAAAFICAHGGGFINDVLGRREVLELSYRAAARKLHPDAGGNHEQFVQLQAAKRTVELAQGSKGAGA